MMSVTFSCDLGHTCESQDLTRDKNHNVFFVQCLRGGNEKGETFFG